MPQHMKFWELVSAFDEATLRAVLGSPRWRAPYLGQYEQLDTLVRQRERRVLDAPVPLDLSRELAARCPSRFIYDPASRHLREPRDGESPSPGVVEMSAIEVHDQFGGSALEEVHEKGVAKVVPPA